MGGGSIAIAVGETLPISLQIDDGNAGLFPQASLRDDTGASLGTINLSHVAAGMYSGASFAMPDTPWVSATYIVYTDAAHTIESTVYARSLDVFARDEAAGLTAQEVRDAMKLAPSAGAPAPESIDARTEDLDAAIAFLGSVIGSPVTHTPTSITVGGFVWSVSVVGSTVTLTRTA